MEQNITELYAPLLSCTAITGTALSYPSTLSFEAVPPEVGTQGTMYRTTIKMYISTPSKVKKKNNVHIYNALKDALTIYKVPIKDYVFKFASVNYTDANRPADTIYI